MRVRLERELWIFCRCVTFYTRLSVPPRLERYLSRSGAPEPPLTATAKFLPSVGLVVGVVASVVYSLSQWCFGPALAGVLTVSVAALLTGALHEDGLADAADGFGGGWNRDEVLQIMKDSRHGTYGVMALTLGLAVRAAALAQMPAGVGVPAILVSHTASRWVAVSLMSTLVYARAEGKAQPAVSSLSMQDCLVAGIPVLICSWWLPYPPYMVIVVAAALALLRQAASGYFYRRLGGYTGDCLGAVQQAAEALTLLIIAARPWTYI